LPQHRLTVIGAGTNAALVAKAAEGAANITLRPPVPHAELVELMRATRAMIFAAEEDFGITMVEAQACGTPVIAFGEGGARDIFAPGLPQTGVLFEEQSVDSIIAAVRRFETLEPRLTPELCRANALRFSEAAFRERFMEAVAATMANTGRGTPQPPHTPDIHAGPDYATADE
jgi:glycosyltransferase involved in cell wall biosynthesis